MDKKSMKIYCYSSKWEFIHCEKFPKILKIQKKKNIQRIEKVDQNWSGNLAHRFVFNFCTHGGFYRDQSKMLMSPDSSINSHQRKSPTRTMPQSIVVQNQQSPASSMHQMRHHNRASSSMGDGDDGVSSATSSTHRPYMFMQSCSVPQFATDSGANVPFYSARAPTPAEGKAAAATPKWAEIIQTVMNFMTALCQKHHVEYFYLFRLKYMIFMYTTITKSP